MTTHSKMSKRTFWTIFSIAVIAGIVLALAQDASILVSAGIGLAGGLVMVVVVRLINRKKMTA